MTTTIIWRRRNGVVTTFTDSAPISMARLHAILSRDICAKVVVMNVNTNEGRLVEVTETEDSEWLIDRHNHGLH